MGKDPRYELNQSGSPRSLEWTTQACEQSPFEYSWAALYSRVRNGLFFWPEALSVRGIKPTERENWCPESRAPCRGTMQ